MNGFLNDELHTIVQKAASALLQLKDIISEEWNILLKQYLEQYVMDENEEKINVYTILSTQYFWDQIKALSCGENAESTLDPIHHELLTNIPEQVDANLLIFITTMLESTALKIMKDHGFQSYYDQQSLQYLFFNFTQQLLPFKNHTTKKDVRTLIKDLLVESESPFYWISIVKEQKEEFKVEEIFTHKDYLIDESWLSIAKKLSAPTIEFISESLLRLLEQKRSEDVNIIPLSLPSETLLLCVQGEKTTKSLLTFILNVVKENESALKDYKLTNNWKDALILFDELIMQANSLEDAIDKVSSGLIHYLPFERTAIFSLKETNSGKIGIGMFGRQVDLKAIQNIREDLTNLPVIKESLENIQPVFVPKAEAVFPSRYVQIFELESTVFIPLFSPSKNRLWGGMLLDQGGGKEFELSNHHIAALMKFGTHAGEILEKFSSGKLLPSQPYTGTHLSPREQDILRLMANGYTIDEAAEELFLSKYTVRDYVSDIIKKMNAKNRTHAVASGIRQGII
ncbi:helix-turn-helix domain-containing protein [Alkalihalobacterium elongatum]|uniref:helix-turn-helix domain-containing protein n=1 Tax=Alkalihalobacterium elongatum TaxID=2675466 RepID=UPI001C1F28B9|nr:LuxR C-terminal-related transcriptional regulator [Alkalihalobacterium elongatum]